MYQYCSDSGYGYGTNSSTINYHYITYYYINASGGLSSQFTKINFNVPIIGSWNDYASSVEEGVKLILDNYYDNVK